MPTPLQPWHYLIVTAGNDQQAAAYEAQIRMRREAGFLAQVRDTLVVADPQGCRVGSGGSTLQCLLEILRRESAGTRCDFARAAALLRKLRILIVHAGGDSRRLPAYSPCGKIFVPLPGETRSTLMATLFDRLVPAFLALPPSPPEQGQIVVAAGDALILFDPGEVSAMQAGITALGSKTTPEEAARHGVFCPGTGNSVRLYLQKPDIRRQQEAGAIGTDGRTVLDIGVMSLDAPSAVQLLRSFCLEPADSEGGITWTPEFHRIVLDRGIDLYREICAALGTDATFDEYLRTVRGSGSRLDEAVLARLFAGLRSTPLHLEILSRCDFLHFGSTGQLISNGVELVKRDSGAPPPAGTLVIDTEIQGEGRIEARDSWVEGCRVHAPMHLRGQNVVAGLDVSEPLDLPETACLDLTPGRDREGRQTWFVRFYGVRDTFSHSLAKGATFCGKPLAEWMQLVGVENSALWDSDTPEANRTLWNARVFPAEREHGGYRRWKWMLDADTATAEQKQSYLAADRYSSAEIAVRVDHGAFHGRRAAIRASGRG